MKVNPFTVTINNLIDEHNHVSAYADCPGCDLCLEVEQISRAAGMWIDEVKSEAIEKMKINRVRSAQLSKEELEKLIKAGLTNKEISKKLGLTEKIIGHKIKAMFPDLNRRRRRTDIKINLDQYNEMRKSGITRKDIAKQHGVSTVCLDNHIAALKMRERRRNEEDSIC